MKVINEAKKHAKNQPKIYKLALIESLKNVKSEDTNNKLKEILVSLNKGSKLNKNQANTLFMLLSTKKIHQKIIEQFDKDKYQQAMLNLFLVMYNNSSWLSKFLMRSYMRQGLSNILKK